MQPAKTRGLWTLEVIVSFDGAVLGVHHLQPGQSLRLGPPLEEAQRQPDYALLELAKEVAVASHGALPTVVFPTGAESAVTLKGGVRRTHLQLREAGLCEEIDGGLRYALPRGAHAEVQIGALSVRVAEVQLEASAVSSGPRVDWRSHRFTAASLLLHGGVLALAFLVPPDPRALASNDLSRLDNETLRTRYIPAVVELQRLPQMDAKTDGGAAPRALAGAVGHAGSRKVAQRIVTTVKEARPPMRSGQDLLEVVRKSGVLALMGESMKRGPLAQITDRDTSALGQDADAVLTGLVATTDQLGFGEGGAHLVQTGGGPGGGCVGPGCGTVAVSLSGICDGGGCDSLQRSRLARGPKITGRSHRPETPPPTIGPIETSGGLDKEIVRRVIRSRMNEFKFCYEKELVRAPELSGRVVMSFLISKDGRVVTAGARESTLGSPAVHGCLAQAVGRLSFPMPQNAGVVQVSYPFVFHSADK